MEWASPFEQRRQLATCSPGCIVLGLISGTALLVFSKQFWINCQVIRIYGYCCKIRSGNSGPGSSLDKHLWSGQQLAALDSAWPWHSSASLTAAHWALPPPISPASAVSSKYNFFPLDFWKDLQRQESSGSFFQGELSGLGSYVAVWGKTQVLGQSGKRKEGVHGYEN